MVQNGPLNNFRATAKLFFYTPSTLTSAAATVLSIRDDLGQYKVVLEVFRLLALGSNDVAELTTTMYERLSQNANAFSRPHLTYWLCHLFVTLAGKNKGGDPEEDVDANELAEKDQVRWESLLDVVHESILSHHAMQVLEKYQGRFEEADSNTRRELSAIATFVQQNFKDESLDVDLPPFEWSCGCCGKSEVKDPYYADCVTCETGHQFPRCFLTLRPCDSPALSKCDWCEAVCLPTASLSIDLGSSQPQCVFCQGPIVAC